MQFVFEQVRVGGDRNFGYLIGDRKAGEAVLVDPAYAPEILLERAQAQRLRIIRILNTHGHADHTNGNAEVRRLTGALVAAGPGAGSDIVLNDGDRLTLGRFHLKIWHVPGHAPDHLAFLVEEHAVGLTGDLLFVGKVGGTHSDEDGRIEWRSLQRLMCEWPPTATLWPGHDYGVRPSSTLDLEQATNPFLQCKEVEAFLQLKRDWTSFKTQNGLK